MIRALVCIVNGILYIYLKPIYGLECTYMYIYVHPVHYIITECIQKDALLNEEFTLWTLQREKLI